MQTTALRPAAAAASAHRPGARIRVPVLGAGLGVVLAVSVLFAVTIGPAQITFGEAWQSVFAHLGFGDPALSPLRDGIIWQLRMPRILTAGAVGAGLALCGAVMQALTRNPLADPYLLGLSSGASLGAVGVILLGVGVLLPVAAFGGAIVALAATLLVASAAGTLTPTRTILAGLAVSSFFGALTSLAIFWSATGDTYREILSWLLGSLSGAQWSSVAIAGAALAVVGVPLLFSGRVLDAFAFGDTAASALGVSVTRTRWIMLTATALLTGALVAVSGAIGFIGLILPHMVRLVVGRGNRRVLPLAALTGAIFLIWVDTAARTVFDPRELPVGILTAAIGAPVFALLLLRSRSSS
ncbi:putative F420-0 ABC transporter permease subunit [Homoserinimonas sp. OAct 916]|uniref:putative F420-0 ABC transporter permease subunit n=1 Tax=Homoserinimonas sp. OAct 916 TaxID=2211450 RepID=UPI000DBE9BE6|nr:putative F420-0 ABC transporter permease subunit [Homoserinimonas sp. OAct 916]